MFSFWVKAYLCDKFYSMKGKDAVLYIMGMIMIVMILLFFMQIYMSGK